MDAPAGQPFYVRPRLDPGFIRWLLEFRGNSNRRRYEQGLEAIAELNRRTFAAFDGLHAAGVPFEEHRTGILMAFHRARDSAHEAAELRWLERFGYGGPVTGRPQDLEPALGDEIGGAYLLPQERHVDPASLAAGLVATLRERGATVLEQARVVAIEPARRAGSGVAEVRTSTVDGESEARSADAVVVAAGAWTPRLLRGIRARVPIIPGKGYCLDFSPAPIALRQPLYLADDRVAASPYDGSLRLSGTMELTGLDTGVSRRRVGAIARAGARYLRGWPPGARPASVGAGMRPMTPDGLPLLGRVPNAPGIWVASGHSMLGVTLGPASGEALALAIGGTDPDVLKPFDPARFG